MRILDHLQQSVKSAFKFSFPPSVIHVGEGNSQTQGELSECSGMLWIIRRCSRVVRDEPYLRKKRWAPKGESWLQMQIRSQTQTRMTPLAKQPSRGLSSLATSIIPCSSAQSVEEMAFLLLHRIHWHTGDDLQCFLSKWHSLRMQIQCSGVSSLRSKASMS